ncbi:MAG: YtoQ family protein [Candidatus Latescibacteria bacterium]|nr:YtoQ family protein [Candidatus Latescibacterota bacterium]
MQMCVYLSGEIHSDWRDQIVDACASEDLPIAFLSPVTDHGLSDRIGADVLGEEADAFWGDHKSAKINAIRTRGMVERADAVVVKFGDEYKQWNAAFDAGYAVAKGKPLIVLHPDNLRHPLKEVDAAALAVAQTPKQVAEILRYVTAKQGKIDS